MQNPSGSGVVNINPQDSFAWKDKVSILIILFYSHANFNQINIVENICIDYIKMILLLQNLDDKLNELHARQLGSIRQVRNNFA